MKFYIKIILLTITCLMLASCGKSDNKDSDSNSSFSREPKNTHYNKKVCQDAYGQWHSSMSRCSTCGTSYCVEYLPYGKYCSQNCCAAYEGLSSKCGY